MRQRSRLSVGAVVVTALALLVAACGGSGGAQGTTDSVTGTSTQGTATSGKSVLNIAIPSEDPPNMDPDQLLSIPTLTANIFEGLTAQNSTLTELQPALATKWVAKSDTEWEFTLRQGVTYHDGEPFNAEAAKFSIERALKNPNGTQISEISSVTAVGDYTIDIKTSKPIVEMPRNMAVIPMLPPKYMSEHGDDSMSKNPIGTGPYKFVSRTKDQVTTIESYDKYWGAKAITKTVNFIVIPETSARIAALQQGDVDIVTNLPADQRQVVESMKGAGVAHAGNPRILYVFLRSENGGPLADKRVRQALNYGVNKQAMIDGLYGGLASQTATFLVPGDSGYDANIKPYGYDPDKAKALLADAGYGNGLSLDLLAPNGHYPQDVETAQAIVGDLAKIGVTVNLTTPDWAEVLNRYNNKDFKDMLLLGYAIPTMTADAAFVNNVYAPSIKTFNQVHPDINQLVDKAKSTVDEKERDTIYSELQKLEKDEADFIFLWQVPDIYGVSDRVTGFDPAPTIAMFKMSAVGVS